MEEMISKFYKAQGYTVSFHVIYKVPDDKTVKDIEILAMNNKETVIIECRPYTGHIEITDMTKATIQDFVSSEKAIKEVPMIKGKKITKTLVVEEPIEKTDKELEKKGITVYLLEDLMVDFLALLLKKHKGKRFENRAADMIRNLIFSIIEERV